MGAYETLSKINVNDKTQKKGKLTYLSWAFAWDEVLKLYPSANYKVYENADGWNYHTDGKTAWVKVGMTIENKECVEYLPIMDNYNNSIPLDKITSRNVSDAIQRAVTKAIARHGLGIYIYCGEDVPSETPEEIAERKLAGENVEMPTPEQFAAATKQAAEEKAEKKASAQQKKKILEMCAEKGKDINKALEYYKVANIDELSYEQATAILGALK